MKEKKAKLNRRKNIRTQQLVILRHRRKVLITQGYYKRGEKDMSHMPWKGIHNKSPAYTF